MICDHLRPRRFKRIGLGAAAIVASGFALQVTAQDLSSLTGTAAGKGSTPAPAPESPANEARRLRVETALRDDPYFDDGHVTVLLKNGAVISQGFVFTEWDLLHAIRIAKKAAGDGRVIDDLSIELGGRR